MSTIPADIQNLIAQEMALGHYASEEELLRQAMEALRNEREALICDDETLAAVKRGLADSDARRLTPRAEFEREFRDRNHIADRT